LKTSNKLRVSVCLAAYNGERFIAEQVRSILGQLSRLDELIICDDGSQDGTRDIVAAIDDSRLVLQSFSSNVGHVWNFERAIKSATGDLIFLSDQDDVWSSDKYRMVVDCFVKNPDVLLVQHALSTTDANGYTLAQLWNPLHEGRQIRILYLLRQLVKCQVFGCAVAFRRSLIDVVLPFPVKTYAHDHWLAVAAGMCGSVFFLNKPLVRYRQHDANFTPKSGLHWRDRVSVRLRLLAMIAVAIFRRLRKLIGQH
jgi:glycosyltransferase involved in cell wall biosynthesis